MVKKDVVLVTDYESPLTFAELCEVCQAPSELVYEFISFEIIHPSGNQQAEWKFDLEQLRRIKTAMRLRHDLEVNMQGIAIILDLLEEINLLRNKAELFEKHHRGK